MLSYWRSADSRIVHFVRNGVEIMRGDISTLAVKALMDEIRIDITRKMERKTAC